MIRNEVNKSFETKIHEIFESKNVDVAKMLVQNRPMMLI